MPFFVGEPRERNVLFIHPPKTGGTSVQTYFAARLGPARDYVNEETGYVFPDEADMIAVFGDEPQEQTEHFSYRAMAEHGHRIGLDVSDSTLRVIATVRNPYLRLVSDMYFFTRRTRITVDSTPDEMEAAITKFLANPDSGLASRTRTQFEMICDDSGTIPERVKIMHCETLVADMQAAGFEDFDVYVNGSRVGLVAESDYMPMLTQTARELIESYYAADFEAFGYSVA